MAAADDLPALPVDPKQRERLNREYDYWRGQIGGGGAGAARLGRAGRGRHALLVTARDAMRYAILSRFQQAVGWFIGWEVDVEASAEFGENLNLLDVYDQQPPWDTPGGHVLSSIGGVPDAVGPESEDVARIYELDALEGPAPPLEVCKAFVLLSDRDQLLLEKHFPELWNDPNRNYRATLDGLAKLLARARAEESGDKPDRVSESVRDPAGEHDRYRSVEFLGGLARGHARFSPSPRDSHWVMLALTFGEEALVWPSYSHELDRKEVDRFLGEDARRTVVPGWVINDLYIDMRSPADASSIAGQMEDWIERGGFSMTRAQRESEKATPAQIEALKRIARYLLLSDARVREPSYDPGMKRFSVKRHKKSGGYVVWDARYDRATGSHEMRLEQAQELAETMERLAAERDAGPRKSEVSVCPACRGEGSVNPGERGNVGRARECASCGGTGRREVVRDPGGELDPVQAEIARRVATYKPGEVHDPGCPCRHKKKPERRG